MAFVVGICTAIPVFVLRQLGVEAFIPRVIVIVFWLLYFVSLLFFVAGPQYWAKYSFHPIDGLGKVLTRGFAWLIGDLICVAVLETINLL